MNTPHERKRYLLSIAGVLVVALFAFIVGRVSVGPGAVQRAAGRIEAGDTAQRGQSSEHRDESQTKEAGSEKGTGEEGSSKESSGEKGHVKFAGESLLHAHVGVEPITYRSLQARLAVTGTVEPNLAGVVKVTPRIAGKITSVQVNVGDTVHAGQPLAALTSTDLEQAQAAYRQAAARVAVAESNLHQQQKLAHLGAFGRPSVETARAQAVIAESEINTAQNDVAAAQAGVAEAISQLRSLQAALDQARTQVKVTQSRFNRADLLLKDELVSRQDWEQAQADYQRAQADTDAAQANLAQGQAKVDTAKANLGAVRARLAAARKRGQIEAQALTREEAVYQGGYATRKEIIEAEAARRQAQLDQRAAAENIRLLGGVPGGGNLLVVQAPLGGRVTERLVTLGETVTPDKPLFTIINLRTVWVQLSVYPKDLPGVRVGQAVTVTADIAPGRIFTGSVSSIGAMMDEMTRTVEVRAVIQNRDNALKPQTFVRGAIAAAVAAHRLAVPRDAVQSYEGKRVVFVQADHKGEFVAKAVQTGDTVDGQTVITSGLEPGERVVTRGAFMVKAQAMKGSLGEQD